MIFDTMAKASSYEALCPRISAALKAAAAYPTDPYVTGRVVVDGDKLYMNVVAYETKPLGEASLMEAHQKYIDVMVMVEGEETIYVKTTDELTNITMPYDDAKEALLATVDADVTPIRLTAGHFAVLFPQDAHCPSCCVDAPANVKKIICKVAID